MIKFETIEHLLEVQLKDIFSAEAQLAKALPKIGNAAANTILQKTIANHLLETQKHIIRLKKISDKMKVNLVGNKCKAMEVLIEGCKEAMDVEGNSYLIDVGIIAAVQKIEQFEMSAYASAIILTEKTAHSEVLKLLKESYKEESAAYENLSSICKNDILAKYSESEKYGNDQRDDESDGYSESARKSERSYRKDSSRKTSTTKSKR